MLLCCVENKCSQSRSHTRWAMRFFTRSRVYLCACVRTGRVCVCVCESESMWCRIDNRVKCVLCNLYTWAVKIWHSLAIHTRARCVSTHTLSRAVRTRSQHKFWTVDTKSPNLPKVMQSNAGTTRLLTNGHCGLALEITEIIGAYNAWTATSF